MCRLVLAPHNREGVHDIVHVLPRNPVQDEVQRVQFGPQPEAPLVVPDERFAPVAQVTRKGREVVGGVGQFEDAGSDEG